MKAIPSSVMEGFLEANRIVEVSLNKLSANSKSGDLSLRKTLLVSKVLNRAQDVATSAHMSLINNTSTTLRSSSKLLANISTVESSEVYETDCLPAVSTRAVKLPRPPSPIVCHSLARTDEEEPMDFENMISNNSVLQYILADNDGAAVDSPPFDMTKADGPVRNRNEQHLSPKRKLLQNISNSQEWPSNYWRSELTNSLKHGFLDQTWSTGSGTTTQPPVSPGKRGHREAFQFDKESSCLCDDSKRFKPCHSNSCTTEECLNCVCDHLSPRNIQSEPLLAYMLGKGFNTASLLDDGWPPAYCPENHFMDTIHSTSVTPIFAF